MSARSSLHPAAAMSAIVRTCGTKKELQQHFKGSRLESAWTMLQIRAGRFLRLNGMKITQQNAFNSHHWNQTPRPRDNGGDPSDWQSTHYTADYIKPEYRRQVFYWPYASHYSYRFSSRISDKVESIWPYTWQDKKYSIGCRHTRGAITVKGSRGADSYTYYSVDLRYNLLTHEAVVIGGMLTIRAKADRDLDSYPCCWLERLKNSPGLIVVHGRIENRDFHVLEDPAIEGKTEATKFKRKLARLRSTPPAGSPWVTREDSLAAGNCERGTDNFIRNKLDPWLKKQGGLGFFPGLCIHITALLSLQRDHFTLRIAQYIRTRKSQAA